MNVIFYELVLSFFITFSKATLHYFNVVSILGEGYTLGVKFNNNTDVKVLDVSTFPLFKGIISAEKIENYKYVALDKTGFVIDEENIERTYSSENSKINEVYNRENLKDIEIPDLPQPFKTMFPMGSNKFRPIPNNIIYNIYAKCDEDGYNYLTESPFLNEDRSRPNNNKVNCTINIISPENVYKRKGTIHLIGYGSRRFKKLTWGLKFDKKFLGRSAIKLRAMANDPTHIREKLATELYKSVGVPIQEGTYARLFINGDTYGLYHMIDSFSKKWLKGYVHGDTTAKVGISYKLYAHVPYYPDLKYIGDDYHDYARFYIPDEYEDEDVSLSDEPSLYKHVMEFIRLFDEWTKMPDQPIEELEKFFNIELTLRFMVIDTLILALDNFTLRLSNTALYYIPEREEYILLPYDFDKVLKGFSGDEVLDEETYLSDCHTWATQHEEIIDHYFIKTLLNHPEIKARYDVILSITSQEIFTKEKISEYVNAVADLIRQDMRWTHAKASSLTIPYNGIVNQYTIDQFEGNIGYEPVGYYEGVVNNDAPWGIIQWVEVRSDYCRRSTDTVDTSNNENISDNDVQVSVYEYNDIENKDDILENEEDDDDDDSGISMYPISPTLTIFILLVFSVLFNYYIY